MLYIEKLSNTAAACLSARPHRPRDMLVFDGGHFVYDDDLLPEWDKPPERVAPGRTAATVCNHARANGSAFTLHHRD